MLTGIGDALWDVHFTVVTLKSCVTAVAFIAVTHKLNFIQQVIHPHTGEQNTSVEISHSLEQNCECEQKGVEAEANRQVVPVIVCESFSLVLCVCVVSLRDLSSLSSDLSNTNSCGQAASYKEYIRDGVQYVFCGHLDVGPGLRADDI